MADNQKGPQLSRRWFLGGLAAAPVAVAAAPAALASPTASAALLHGLTGTNAAGLAGIVAQRGLNVDTLFSEAMRLSGCNDDEMVSYLFSNIFCEAKQLIEPSETTAHDLLNGLRLIMWRSEFIENDEFDNFNMLSLGTSIRDVFSPEAKFAYFLKYKEKDEPIDVDWEKSAIFTAPDSYWGNATKMLDSLGIPCDSPLDVNETLAKAGEIAIKQIVPKLRAAYQRDPEGFMRETAECFFNWDEKSYIPQLEKIFPSIDISSAKTHDNKAQQLSFKQRLRQAKEEMSEQTIAPPAFVLHRIPSNTFDVNVRYVAVTEGKSGQHWKIEKSLKKRYPALNDGTEWNAPFIFTQPGSEAEKILDCLCAEHAHTSNDGSPTNQVVSLQHFGTALACASTASEFRRGVK